MSLAFDPEFAPAMEAMSSILPPGPRPPVGDVDGRRARAAAMMSLVGARFPDDPSVTRTDHTFPSPHSPGHTHTLSEYRAPGPRPTEPSSAVFYVHGGGMILGNVEAFQKGIRVRAARQPGIPIFAAHYRLAPEFPHPVPVQDVYAGLEYLLTHAAELGVDPKRIVVHGESAGGGLAAGMALMARDKGLTPRVGKLVLNFPMLDDRTSLAAKGAPDGVIEGDPLNGLATWTHADNLTGWGALLGEKVGGGEVDYYAAPGRAEDLTGLPPVWIDCGQLDIFVAENVAFVAKLIKANVPVEFHLYPGVPHGFAAYAPQSVIAKLAIQTLQAAFASV